MLIPPKLVGFPMAVLRGDVGLLDPARLAEPPVPEVTVLDAGCLWPGVRDRWATHLARAMADAEFPVSAEAARAWVDDAPRDHLIRAMAEQTRMSPEVLQPLLHAVWLDFEERVRVDGGTVHSAEVAPGAAEALAALQTEGCRVLVAGPVPRAVLGNLVAQLGWSQGGLVDGCLGDEDGVASGSPSSAAALNQMGCHPLGLAARVVASPAAARRSEAGNFSRLVCLGSVPPPDGRQPAPGVLAAANFGEMLAALLARELQ